MNEPSYEAQPLADIVSVAPNVVLRDLGVQGEETLHTSWLCEYVGGMAQLRRLDDDRLLKGENVFATKQVGSAGSTRELTVEERVIIGTPTDLSDIEISRNTHRRTHPFQLCSLDGSVFQR